MSLSVTTDVFCDGPDCRRWQYGTQGRLRAEGREARRVVQREAGWVYRDGLDLCPACVRAEDAADTQETTR